MSVQSAQSSNYKSQEIRDGNWHANPRKQTLERLGANLPANDNLCACAPCSE